MKMISAKILILVDLLAMWKKVTNSILFGGDGGYSKKFKNQNIHIF